LGREGGAPSFALGAADRHRAGDPRQHVKKREIWVKVIGRASREEEGSSDDSAPRVVESHVEVVYNGLYY
jgi:hypothetical protein